MPSVINLARVVTDVLGKHSAAAAAEWSRQYEEYNRAYQEQNELSLINRFWRIQLGRIGVSTISERECLIDNIAVEDWLFHFERSVVPMIIANGLPLR